MSFLLYVNCECKNYILKSEIKRLFVNSKIKIILIKKKNVKRNT